MTDGTRVTLSREQTRKVFEIKLREITPDNIAERYRVHFNAFCYYMSASVKVNGKDISKGFDRYFYALDPKNDGQSVTCIPVLSNGFQIRESDFLGYEIDTFATLLDMFGKEIEFGLRAAANAYLSFLRAKQVEIKKGVSGGLDSPQNLFTFNTEDCRHLYTELTKNGSFLPENTKESHFNFVFSGGAIPSDFTPLQWKKGKNALSDLVVFLASIKAAPEQIDKTVKAVPAYINKAAGGVFVLFRSGGITPIGTLSNPGRNRVSSEYKTLETIIAGIKSTPGTTI
ncbi:hypothetical protein [Parabacteroides sp. PF5-9]|uniref:hypothetical protein n=1 Tax=Parabacteroides sp. PF5-9 TaxID=1742404 RepID=UPI002476EE73|nr:hypothetical protein [Parabacteroides sp. PF5-9]MDH6357613.1 hypothetical protein [Parabacteroides sp. PF5-9]